MAIPSFCIYALVTLLMNVESLLALGNNENKISPSLLNKLEQGSPQEKWDVIFEFEQLPPSDTSRPFTVDIRNKMISHADKTQKGIRKLLPNYQSHWLINALSTKGLGKGHILSLAEDKDVIGIKENGKWRVEPEPIKPITQTIQGGVNLREGEKLDPRAWGVDKVGAPAWWEAGYNGSGVIVGVIDTGVEYHPASMDSWVGKEGGWLDPEDRLSRIPKTQDPFIPELNMSLPEGALSHGQFIVGIISGQGIGVAPGARWTFCATCPFGSCYYINLVECGAFMLCPNPEGNCSYRPNIVSNSWGLPSQYTSDVQFYFFDYVIRRWKESGIIPVFAAGNYDEDSQHCEQVISPGNHADAIAIGGVDVNDQLTYFNSYGPPIRRYSEPEWTSQGIFKPDFAAPAEHLFSTVRNQSYGYGEGTSYATPHVAGAIALILSRTEGLNFTQIKDILKKSAFQNVTNYPGNGTYHPAHNESCGKVSDSTIPNFKFGWGRVRLPDPKADWLPPERLPTRKMPPPPDWSESSCYLLRPTSVFLILVPYILSWIN